MALRGGGKRTPSGAFKSIYDRGGDNEEEAAKGGAGIGRGVGRTYGYNFPYQPNYSPLTNYSYRPNYLGLISWRI